MLNFMKFQSLTLRARLVWLTLGLAIPFVLAGLFNLLSFWQASRTQMEEALVQQARLAAWAFEQRLDLQRGTLEMAAIMADRDRNTPPVKDYLDSIVKTRRNWLGAQIVTADGGVVLAESSKQANLPSVSVAALRQTRAAGNSLIVLTEQSPDAKIRLLTLALPTDDGNFVVARINGESVNDIFENLAIPDEDIIAVFDANDRLLYRSSIPPDKISLDVSHSPPILDARARGEGTYEFRSEYDGIERVYGFTRLSSINGIVSVGVPSDRFYAPLRGQLARQLLIGLPLAMLGILAAYLLARSIARPLRRLSQTARDFGAGDLTSRPEITGGGSIGELELAFNRMADEIARREEKLESLDRLKSRFVSSVSHELRTPLTTIKALSSVLQGSKISPSEREEIHETIAVECDRQIDFIQNLLDLSRIESGAYKISLAPTDVVKTLWESIEANQRAALSRKLNLKFKEPPEDLPFALIDAGALRRAVSSLIGNSLKYTPAGGEIVISADQRDDKIAVEISDDGCGIAAEDVPHVFEKFYRGRPLAADCALQKNGDSSGENKYDGAAGGVGLGLYLVRNLVAQIGAEIAVESPAAKNGRGTRFTITLPTAK